jgi:prolipoprotein diacylglyceryltransferase
VRTSGALFSLYLILAGSMKFVVEFWRVNPVVAFGMTEYQWISVLATILGAVLFYQRAETLSPLAL